MPFSCATTQIILPWIPMNPNKVFFFSISGETGAGAYYIDFTRIYKFTKVGFLFSVLFFWGFVVVVVIIIQHKTIFGTLKKDEEEIG